jgi:hypothetical protein
MDGKGNTVTNLIDRYGFLRVLLILLFVFIVVFFISHLIADPGTEVSILWGLMKYTKKNSNSDNSVKEINEVFSNVNNIIGKGTLDSGYVYSPEKVVLENNKINLEKDNDVVDTFNIIYPLIISDIEESNINEKLSNLRSERNLRQITSLESTKSILELPISTYFYIPSMYLSSKVRKNILESVNSFKVNRYQKNNFYFEIHYLQ